MKRLALLLSLALGLALAPEAHAQRTLPGMRGLEVRAGMADGWYSASGRSTTGYPYKAGSIPVAQFTGEGGYYYKFLADGSKTFFLYIGGSALLGYETVNWGDKMLYDGSTIRSREGFLYGGAVTLEAEAYISDRIVLCISGRERVLWGTTTGHFHTQFGIGVKFIID